MVKNQQGTQYVDRDIVPISLREPRSSCLVYAPSYPLLPTELIKLLEYGHLMASPDGSHVAAVVRRMGNSCSVAHSSQDFLLPNVTFGEAKILRVHSDMAVEAWGEYEGTRGVWMLKRNAAPKLTARFDFVERVVPSPLGTVVIGTVGKTQRHYVVRDVTVVVPKDAKVVLDAKGVSHGLLPIGDGKRKSWILPPPTDPRLSADEGGPPIYPLPFGAESVEPFLYKGRLFCVLRDGDASAYWFEEFVSCGWFAKPTGVLTVMSSTDHPEAGVDFVWPSPDGRSTVALIRPNKEDRADGTRSPGISRRLLLNSVRTGIQGSFYMREDDLRWSPDGNYFVAHIRLVDSDGNQREEKIITSDKREFAVHGMASDPTIDDAGRVAYVLDDRTGRHVVVDNAMTSGYPFAWNVAHGEEGVTANVLANGQIHRIEIPYGR